MEKLPLRRVGLFAIDRIAYNRTANVLEMDSELVGSSRLWAKKDKACLFIKGGRLNLRDRLSPIGERCHLFPMHRMAADRDIDRPVLRAAVADGEIELFYPSA